MSLARDAFLVVYGGNIGAAAGVEGVIAALAEMDRRERPLLLIAGSGSQLDACRALADRVDPEQIRFYTPWPAEKTAAVYASADLLVLPTRGAQSLASAPSKLISYMLAGRPVLAQALAVSDTARTIDESGCGWVVQPEDPTALADALRRIRALPESDRLARGEAGRQYALRHLTKETCLPRVVAILEDAALRR